MRSLAEAPAVVGATAGQRDIAGQLGQDAAPADGERLEQRLAQFRRDRLEPGVVGTRRVDVAGLQEVVQPPLVTLGGQLGVIAATAQQLLAEREPLVEIGDVEARDVTARSVAISKPSSPSRRAIASASALISGARSSSAGKARFSASRASTSARSRPSAAPSRAAASSSSSPPREPT